MRDGENDDYLQTAAGNEHGGVQGLSARRARTASLCYPRGKTHPAFVVSFPIEAPNWPEPSYDALVEAWFDTAEDMDALFFSENFRTKVDPDHVNFIDLSSIQRMVAEETIVVS